MGLSQEQQKQARPRPSTPGARYLLPPWDELEPRAPLSSFLVEEIHHLAFSPSELFYFMKIKFLSSDCEAGVPPLLSVAA